MHDIKHFLVIDPFDSQWTYTVKKIDAYGCEVTIVSSYTLEDTLIRAALYEGAPIKIPLELPK